MTEELNDGIFEPMTIAENKIFIAECFMQKTKSKIDKILQKISPSGLVVGALEYSELSVQKLQLKCFHQQIVSRGFCQTGNAYQPEIFFSAALFFCCFYIWPLSFRLF